MLELVPKLPPDAPLRLLCLGAHCDDVEIGAGGTVRRLIAEREAVDVRWVVFSGSERRAAEARASAAWFLAGAREAEVEVLGFRESYFPAQWTAIKDEFFRIREAFAADLVLAHRADDRHQDHRVLGELVWNTWRDHLVLEYEIAKYEGDLGRPNFYAPLTAAAAQEKASAVRRHFASQRDKPWFDEQAFLGLMRLRGLECNAPEGYAEAFHAPKIRL